MKKVHELTEEEKQTIIDNVKVMISPEMPDEPTEYDIFIQNKNEEFIKYLFDLNDKEFLLELCSKDFSSHFSIAVMYDMWLNDSAVWPVAYNPKWEEWNKLKEIKVNLQENGGNNEIKQRSDK